MAVKLNHYEIELLQKAANNQALNNCVKRKAQMILQYANTQNKKEFCQNSNISTRTVQRWIKDVQLACESGKSEQEILDILKDKPFKKRRDITDEEIAEIISMFSKPPCEKGILYSTWDEYTIRQALEKYYPDRTFLAESIKKIIQACRIKYKSDFCDKHCEKSEIYEALLNDESSTYIYCHVYYLGMKTISAAKHNKPNKYNQINAVRMLFDTYEYFYSVFIQIVTKGKLENNYAIIMKFFSKPFVYEDFYKTIINGIFEDCNQQYKIVILAHKKELLELVKLKDENRLASNISFVTIPHFAYENISNEFVQAIKNIGECIYRGKNECNQYMTADSLKDNQQIVFNGRGHETVAKYFKAILSKEMKSTYSMRQEIIKIPFQTIDYLGGIKMEYNGYHEKFYYVIDCLDS